MGFRYVVVGIAVLALMDTQCVIAAPSSRPARPATRHVATTTSTKPATRRSVNTAAASREALRSATAALMREFHDYLNDPKARPLRSSCNYFGKSSADGISTDALIDALDFSGGDARETAYVRWQFLSALPHLLDAAMKMKILAAYRAAPVPIPRPGLSETEQKSLDHFFKGKQMSDEAEVKETWQAKLDAVSDDNQPILAYRDELYHRLPAGFDTFAAALDDLFSRMNAVVDAKIDVKLIAGDVRSWASSPAGDPPTAEQLSTLAKAVRKLADSKGPQYYTAAYWRAGSNTFVWRKTRTGIETGHTLKDLADFLDEQSRQLALKRDGKDGKLAKETTKDKKDNHGH